MLRRSIPAYPLSLLDAITRSQSRTLCFFRYFFVRYLRYLQPFRKLGKAVANPGNAQLTGRADTM